MKFWLGVTDNNWFDFLSNRKFDEVNFWQPSGTPPFTNAPSGMPFLFKLKRPYNHISGGGFFVTYSSLPLTLAWEVFGEKNGAASLDELRNLIEPLKGKAEKDPEIGCTILTNTFYIDRENWFENPPGWSSNVVRGKMYYTENEEGRHIWEGISGYFTAFAEEISAPNYQDTPTGIKDKAPKYGEPVLIKPRLGQSSFRVMVTDAYKRRCAITGENTLVVLEAAHIVPYAGEGTHDVSNGLLLRADFHKLFDVGLVSVTPEYKIKVSPKIRETWFNGKVYYRLDYQPLSIIPESVRHKPDRDRLEWHYKNRFQA
jgi:putative restriction endonuclease